jgi:solute carrier family 45 protein 1/2/4
MGVYSITCAFYSYLLEWFISRLSLKRVYILGQLTYAASMIILAVTKHKVSAVLISTGAGIMYSTLFTIPYILVANYHTHEAVRRPHASLAAHISIHKSRLF